MQTFLRPACLLVAALLLALPAHGQLSLTPGAPAKTPLAAQTTAPYQSLTDDLVEFTNFHPEPFAGIAIDVDGGILAVNPYNNTWVKYAGPTATSLALRVQTGHNPISIGVWNPGPTAQDRRIVVVCTGSHAAFLHAPDDGRILNVVQLDSEPADLALDPEHGWAFVSCRGDNTVLKLDLATFTVVDRYPIGCGRRPGPLYLDTGSPQDPGDTRVYVAPMVTGNNSAFGTLPGLTVGKVVDLDQAGPADQLPDEDVFRIDPFQSGASAVTPVVKRAGSLIFELARHPDGTLWILSTDSNNKSALDSEPAIQGKIVVNQLVRVSGVTATSALITAGAGIDLDDTQPNTLGAQYSAPHSLNQARTLAFQPDGDAFAASPMSDVIVELGADGKRFAELALPHRAQCYALAVYTPNPSIVLALCLGTMTIEVFTEGIPVPGRALALGQDPTPLHVRAGRDIVLDGQISQDGRSSCFACHEGGRTDMLGWSIAGTPTDLKDVMVTQSLLSIADTFPHHWRGERNLDQFRKAFVGLLGAPEALAPTPAQMLDVDAFFHSLKAPANPLENLRRIVDDAQTPGPAPNGMSGSAVTGQQFFLTLPNFNGDTCAECHMFPTGSNANLFAEVPSFAPRVQELEVPHLRQLQVKGLDTFTLSNGAHVNENGFGATHNGHEASVFEFIMNNFPQLQPQDLVHIFFFVLQFDQGLAPGAHWATWFTQQKPLAARDIQQILIDAAEQGWLDVVAFGRFDDGSGPREVRWLYDIAQHKFVNDDPVVGDKTWPEFKAATAAGKAENAFLGVPLGNGFRLAFDPDADDARTGDEIIAGTNPWARDTDRDGWPDGYELENGENPLVPQANPGDDFSPALLASSLEFASARAAKYHVRFSEDVTYVVSYGLPTGPTLTYEQKDFVRADTFVLTHSAPSSPIVPSVNKPDPDGTTVFSALITITDRAGKVVGPVPLAQTFTPLAAQVQLGLKLFMHVGNLSVSAVPTGPDSLSATVTIAPELHYGAPNYIDADGTVVFCNIALQDTVTKHYVQSSSFTTTPPLPTQFFLTDSSGGPPVPYTATPGPFVMCPLTQNGVTQFTFQQGGLTPGQKIKIAVQGILIPDDLANQVYDPGTLLLFQPLLTEDAHEIEITF